MTSLDDYLDPADPGWTPEWAIDWAENQIGFDEAEWIAEAAHVIADYMQRNGDINATVLREIIHIEYIRQHQNALDTAWDRRGEPDE